MKALCAAIGLVTMTMTMAIQAAAQDSCPTRTDLRQGVKLIADNYLNTRVVAETDFGIVKRGIEANGQHRNFEDIPNFLLVGSPHDVLPGMHSHNKANGTITYDIDDLSPNTQFPTPGSHLLDMMELGEKIRTGMFFDKGSWRMLGLAFWEVSEGTVEIEYGGAWPKSPYRLGHCDYDLVTYGVTVTVEDQYPSFDAVYYAPALGLVIGRTMLREDGHPLHTFWFDGIEHHDFWSISHD
jgi:hypothetical protein